MSYIKDIFGLSTDSDASFEGFSVAEMTKTKKTSSGKQPQKQSGELWVFFLSKSQPNQELTEPHPRWQ